MKPESDASRAHRRGVEQAMDGMFYYVAKEEAAIRNDPAARTTELLQKVFGSS